MSSGTQSRETGGRLDTAALRRQHPIAELVASYGIELRRIGTALVGRCPFHRDGGRPNLHVYPSGRWVCYRCDLRGDAIGFVQQIENLSFRDAAAQLRGARVRSAQNRPAPRTPLPRSRPEIAWRPDEHRVLAAATDLYANQLQTDPAALDYMAGRGFPRALLERYRVGYARGGDLISYLRWRGLPLGAAVRTGLITDDGREFLAGRIVFPELRDGRPVWLIGRALPTALDKPAISGPRYLGLPFNKPVLGWDEAMRDARRVVLVEGPMDLLALRLWGVSGLALAGSSLRSDKVALLDQFQRVYLALDHDDGGRKGTDRLFAQLGSRVARLTLPHGVKDVAELAPLAEGGRLFRELLASAARSTSILTADTDHAGPAERRTQS
jgi:DNA primase